MSEEERECPRCKEIKPISAFEVEAAGKVRENKLCEPCRIQAEEEAFANIEPTEGEWLRGTDMDRI